LANRFTNPSEATMTARFALPAPSLGLCRMLALLLCGAAAVGAAPGAGAAAPALRELAVAPGWAANSVNAVVFRKNAVVSDGSFQFTAFYDQSQRVMLARRRLGATRWTVQPTQFRGNTHDAHNAISIMLDGAGFLHLSWDHHNNALHYARSTAPHALSVGAEQPMTGKNEQSVSYPEFHRLPDGDLLFLYRDGASGNGNLVLNRYSVATASWQRVHDNVIDGEGQRNAYWQAFVDGRGTLHLSWVWRESPDVASNHDLCYARSRDGGRSWQRSDDAALALPITAASAEYAARVAQGQGLINQTSMAADADGRPFIASYWRDAGSDVPQYRIAHLDAAGWQVLTLGFRSAPFLLGGRGTKKIPMSRPQILLDGRAGAGAGYLVFRDAERGDRVSLAAWRVDAGAGAPWRVSDLTRASVGDWEPSFDTERWRRERTLDLFVQRVEQVDAEQVGATPPQMVRILEWRAP
jgi:hypothetical protein